MKKITSILLSVVVFANTTYGATPVVTPVAAPAVVKVYVTETGTKYHKATCKHLSKSKIEVDLKKAMNDKEPCKTCHTGIEYQEHMAKVKAHRESQKNLKK